MLRNNIIKLLRHNIIVLLKRNHFFFLQTLSLLPFLILQFSKLSLSYRMPSRKNTRSQTKKLSVNPIDEVEAGGIYICIG